jgi:hypothetical protein
MIEYRWRNFPTLGYVQTVLDVKDLVPLRKEIKSI